MIADHTVAAARDQSQSTDRIAHIDDDADDIESKRSAVEEHIGFGRLEQLDKKSDQAYRNHDVQDARDERRRSVEERKMPLEIGERVYSGRSRRRGPEDWIVVRKEGE